MQNRSETRTPGDELADLFRDVVLIIGGTCAARGIDEETTWQMARALDRVYRRALARCNDPRSRHPHVILRHTAIVGLLALTDPSLTSS
jgi:hypothetical protein